MQLHITSVQRYDKDREGNPLQTKDKRPYTRLVIKTKEHGDKTLSGFDSIQTQNLKEGDELEAEVVQNGEYLNFKLPNKQDLIGKALEEIRNTQLKHGLLILQIAQSLLPKKEAPEYPDFQGQPDFDISPNDIMKQRDEDNPPF